MVVSCGAQKFARNTAKIALSVIHSLKKKASNVLMGCLCTKGAKDHDADAAASASASENRPPAASAVAGGAAIDGTKNVVVALDVRISCGNAAELKGLSGGEHVVAGWPAWLASVAPQAVQGWLPRRADSFEKLDKIGQGTYSIVYKARDLETGKMVALKKVRFVNMDPESVRFMAREIHILRRLDHPNVIKLLGIVTSRASHSLYLVFEYMEHDLAGLVATPGLKLDEPQIKCYVRQLLHGLEHCHSNGVLHRDIKGANLLIGGDGTLKIADFGLAISRGPGDGDPRAPLTSHVVTLWYRPPELLLGATEYGAAVDMWSTGCIVAELFAGKPIMPGRTEVEQIHRIFKLCGSPAEGYCKRAKVPETAMFKPQQQYRRCVAETFQVFPPSALVLIDSLLSLEPEARGTASSALDSEFFRTEPLACDPSDLPKLPPSKEYDVRLRQEEARRQRKTALGGRGAESVRPGNENRVASRAANGTSEMKLRTHASSKSNSEKFNPEDSVPGFREEHRALPTTAKVPGFGSSWNTNHPTVPGRACSSVRVANTSSTMRTKGPSQSLMPHLGVTDLSAVDAADQDHPLDMPASSNRKISENHGRKFRRIHHSGPLMPPGGNIEDMLKEHERHIQEAVRKARVGKPSR